MLSLRGVRKSYSGVEVLHGIDLDADAGEVRAIVGANGAGKSTLIKILCGAVQRDAGEIDVAGRPEQLGNPHAARKLGIRTVHQELTLVPDLSVTENVLLGDLPRRRGLVDWPAAHARTRALLERTGFRGIDVRTHARRLSVARQQMVEIAKAMADEPRVLILDEPSAVLAGDDLDQLFALIRSLRADGVLVLYVSHRLEEVMAIADRVTVIRDGTVTATTTPAETSEAELVRLMAGRRLDQIYPDRRTEAGAELLRTEGLARDGAFDDVSITVRAGEVVGMFGLVGSGRSELAEVLFGAFPRTAGEILLAGRPARLRTPKEAIAAGVALVTEDRKRSGLVLDLSVRDNASLATMRAFRSHGLIDRVRQGRSVEDMTDRLDVRPRGIGRPAKHLSGGNQQKVVLSKWLLAEPKVLILDEPTRGVDVAARVDLYRMVDELTRAGLGVLMISSDLTEVLGMSDRVLVMHEGRVVADLPADRTDEEEVLAYSIGVAT
ncbi:MAG: ATP-binding cassette domain-containing protein [Actinophytocola sp.]|uniref:sugar ABC transporter ATP-binding protein n=1 Tax=Actinophytocola sp. TaxID=1872138 RepID=UPI0013266B49|nr:sugar ABC transporter ATP-binding protein [Actinophytocola sp.]MPZ79230.1 ATP-binding cassette domain-containing protein [Actinophytocola sp.]